MGKLADESELYDKLKKIYDENKGNLTLDVFNQCVDIACEADYREIKFILFKLKCLYDEVDTGNSDVNSITKIIKTLAGDNMKCSFIINVLETALEELKRN